MHVLQVQWNFNEMFVSEEQTSITMFGLHSNTSKHTQYLNAAGSWSSDYTLKWLY